MMSDFFYFWLNYFTSTPLISSAKNKFVNVYLFSVCCVVVSLIPMKVMKEWMEMFLSGNPLYEVASVEPLPAEPTAEQMIELQKLQILNDQDYEQYVVSSYTSYQTSRYFNEELKWILLLCLFVSGYEG